VAEAGRDARGCPGPVEVADALAVPVEQVRDDHAARLLHGVRDLAAVRHQAKRRETVAPADYDLPDFNPPEPRTSRG